VRASEPVLIDTGMAIDRGHFEEALFSLVDPADLRWIVLTHDDRDHAGNLREILMAAPNATLITNGLAVARLGEEWDVPANRVRQLNPGRTLDLGNRELTLLRPPAYDSPSTLAVFDHTSEALFSADAFGAVLPQLVDDVRDIGRTGYLDGLALFTRANAPWTALVDERKFDRILDGIRRLRPRRILSSHAPNAVNLTEPLLETMRAVPSMTPWLPAEDVEVESVLARHEAAAAALTTS
jgi:glyoxylase-like metal-dependent hydrolase (beta-lactamase superfamily II)